MIEEFIQIICSRKNGASKKEIFETAKLFDLNIEPWMWSRLHYAISRGGSIGLYCEKKRWYSYQPNYYVSIVEFVSKNEKGVTDMGMAMGCLSRWIDDYHDIFCKKFPLCDF